MRNVVENIRIFFEVYFRQITLLITEIFIILILVSVLFYIQPLATLVFSAVFSISRFLLYLTFKKKLEDYGKKNNELYTEKFKNLNHGFNAFKDKFIVNRESNLGLKENILSGVSDVLKKYEKIIVLEDDLICESNCLNFLNKSLAFYSEEKDVWQIIQYVKYVI